MKNAICIFIVTITFCFNVSAQDSKMDLFIDDLLNKMALMEKLGQLNLATGVRNLPLATKTSGFEDFIPKGLIGSTAGKRNQEIAVNESRLKIPLIAREDVIHGYNTIFPIPLAMSCMWYMALIEKSAHSAII